MSSTALNPDPVRWQRLETLFYKASDMKPADRAEFLDRECDHDPRMRAEVESLLASAGRTLSDLRETAGEAARDIPGSSLIGRQVGAWRIVSEIGEGDVGRVYLACRAGQNYEQKAAVRIMRKADFGGDPDVLLRFRTERQMLAKLNHPNIARLLEGGVSADGLPYLVMEHIDGTPIDTYCRERPLSIKARLRLFRTVCAAVEYAHRNLVIHRDIKPANILITGVGVPKLLDFGIARLLDPEFAGAARTRAEYASPEQVRGESVTTATDVYALGVLLYELLTGVRPAQEPAAGRLKGDLDRIVMMAIRKEPERRYASVEQLSGDVEAYLRGYPVHAHTDSWTYRSGTFVRRHKAGVAATAAFALALAGFGIGMGVLAKRAERQRQIAEHEKQFMTDLLSAATPEAARGETVTARMLLDRGAQRIDRELLGEPWVRGSLLQTMGEAYRSLGFFDRARTMAAEALAIDNKLYGRNSSESWRAEELVAELDRDQGHYADAEALLNRVLARRQAAFGETSPEAASVMAEIGECLYEQTKDDEAIALLRHTLAINRIDGPAYGASTRNYLALTLERKGDFEEASKLLEEAVDINRRIKGTNSLEYATSLHNLGSALIDRGDLLGAEARLREALAIRRVVLGTDHPDFAMSLNKLGYVLLELGDWRHAEPLEKESLQMNLRRLSLDNPQLAISWNNWARVLQAEGAYADAGDYYNRALGILKQADATSTWPYAQVLSNIGMLYFDRNDYPRAERYAGEALEVRRKLGADDTPAYAASLMEVAEDRAFQGDLATAERLLCAALEIRRQKLVEGHPAIITTMVRLGEVLVIEKKSAQAESMLRKAVDAAGRERFPLPGWQIAEAQNALGECLRTEGKTGAAQLLGESREPLMSDPRPVYREGAIAALRRKIAR